MPVTLPRAGAYRVFADFSVGGAATTLATDLAVDGDVTTTPLPAPRATAQVDGMQVRLDEARPRRRRRRVRAALHRHARRPARRGRRPTSAPRATSSRCARATSPSCTSIPDERSLRFEATFPTAGRYRLFLQFQVGGRVHTAEFTQEVGR